MASEGGGARCVCGSPHLNIVRLNSQDRTVVYCLICHAMTNVDCYGMSPSYFHRVSICAWCRSYEFVVDDTMVMDFKHVVCHSCGNVSSSIVAGRPDLLSFRGWLRVCKVCDEKLGGDDGHEGMCDSCGIGEIRLGTD
jgi:hypothetical protein